VDDGNLKILLSSLFGKAGQVTGKFGANQTSSYNQNGTGRQEFFALCFEGFETSRALAIASNVLGSAPSYLASSTWSQHM
jgi:hypothetical protein